MREKLAKHLELPPDIFGGISGMNIKGRGEILIYGCLNVMKYEDDIICLRLCDMTLMIYGNDMELRTFHNKQMMVTGKFTKIEFEV